MMAEALRASVEGPAQAALSVMANHHFDSRRWQAIEFRPGDLIVSSWAKSGTTWLQQILCQLVHDGKKDLDVCRLSPWVDFRITPIGEVAASLDAQSHQRVMKSHLPADALPLSPQARYLYIAREPLDTLWSWYCHHREFTDEAFDRLNNTPGRVGPPLKRPDPDFRAYLHRWLREDGYPFHPYWSNVRSWWERRDSPNILLVHFADLRRALDLQLRRLAAFIGVRPSAAAWERILRHCSLDHMRSHAELVAPLGGAIFKGGARSFIRTGRKEQWAGQLDEEDRELCIRAAYNALPEDCVKWLFDNPDL